MRNVDRVLALILILLLLIAIAPISYAQLSQDKYVLEYQDPAGDVLKFNATINGEAVDDPEVEALDIKWIYSEADGQGNVILKIDLKSKLKFINEDETKYVLRILTRADNKTGYNITYTNQTATLVPFSPQGNGTAVDYISSITFDQNRGDEMMVVTISISEYLNNITYFNTDAYSMTILDNATFLDYTSELPGHPEYVDPNVESGENLDDGADSDSDKDGDGSSSRDSLALVAGAIAAILIVIVLLIWKLNRHNRGH